MNRRAIFWEKDGSSSWNQKAYDFDPPKYIASLGENIIQIKLTSYPKSKDG